jgi:F-type H+-transporting ATPase subunit gamma
MASLKNIKLKILSYKKTGTVTHAMEAVSAVKMRKSQERALGGRAYAAAALSVLERLSGTADVSKHVLMRSDPIVQSDGIQIRSNVCFIVVTSDKGLAGALNSGVIRKVEREITERGYNKSHLMIIAIGRRGGDYFASRGYNVISKLENLSDDISEREINAITENIVAMRTKGDIVQAHIVYQNFISTFEQQPTVRQLVPITQEMIGEMIAGIRPARGKYAPQQAEAVAHPAAYTIEPDTDSVLSVLLPRLLNIAVFHAVLESKASEHSARMVAMKSATDKAKEKAKDFTRIFNKVRQAAITREVSEITSGIEAMK